MSSLPLLLVVVFLLASAAAFNSGPCDGAPRCKCKWSQGKRMADCSNAGFQNIPTTLSPDIQSLILDSNPLRKLGKDVFKTAGLLNVQTLSLRRCRLEYVDDNAFRDLKIMTHLDLSFNNITKVNPKTFDGNEGLKTMKLSNNPISQLVYYNFPPLSSLKSIDLSNCALTDVDKTAFKNLGGSVESVLLDNNQLTSLREEVFVPLTNLKRLTLHSNPWVCDCKLKNFRDWVSNRGLYQRPTACSEPSRLNDKMWDQILPAEFACKPILETPVDRVFAAPGVDVTLSCHIMGSPIPQARWVVNGRIVNNNTHPTPFADQTYVLHDEKITHDGVERWYNLTITNPSEHDLDKYLCVAENNGGVMEKAVVLTFDDPATYAAGIPITDEQMTIIIGVSVTLALLLLILLFICCCCFCNGKDKDKSNKNRVPSEERNGYIGSDSQKLLPSNGSVIAVTNGTNPLPKPPRDYHGLPQTDVLNDCGLSYMPGDKYDHEMQDMRAPSVISTTKQSSTTGSSASDGARTVSVSRASFIGDNDHYPDLLDHHRNGPMFNASLTKPHSASPSSGSGGSTLPDQSRMHTLNPANLMMNPQQQAQYAHLISPFQRSGTLPLPHHHHHPRSVSCDHTSSPIPVGVLATPHGYHVAPLPVIHHHHHHPNQAQSRPGYVTLPRRPRSSWSVPRDSPSPSVGSHRADREPIYDGIGPRTSADGSSRLNLNKSLASPNPSHTNTLPAAPRYTLPPYYAPIQELAECPPTPKQQQSRMQPNLPKSTPNMLDMNGRGSPLLASSSEATLVEENISAYCEPFGKAELPEEKAKEKRDNNRDSIASDGSDLSLVKPKQPPSSEGKKKGKSNGLKSSTPLKDANNPSSLGNGDASVLSAIPNGHEGRKAAPKTLPKPKVKPVPPPKPKKSFQENGDAKNDTMDSQAPLISFQDEGVDGSEV